MVQSITKATSVSHLLNILWKKICFKTSTLWLWQRPSSLTKVSFIYLFLCCSALIQHHVQIWNMYILLCVLSFNLYVHQLSCTSCLATYRKCHPNHHVRAIHMGESSHFSEIQWNPSFVITLKITTIKDNNNHFYNANTWKKWSSEHFTKHMIGGGGSGLVHIKIKYT